MNALFDFFFTNGRARLRAYLVSGGIALSYALVNIWALGRKEEDVVPEMIVVLIFSALSFVVWHIFKGRVISSAALPKFTLRFTVAGVISLCLLVSFQGIDVAGMQANIGDAVLDHFSAKFGSAQAASLSPNQLQASIRRIQSIVTVSKRNEVPVNPETLLKTGNALAQYMTRKRSRVPQQVQQAGYSTALDLQSFGYLREAQAGGIATPPIASVARQISGEGYVINSPLILERQDSFFQGNHSLMVLGESLTVSKVTVVFKGIDFKVVSAYPPLIVGEGGRLVVIDSIFQGGEQPLDNISWIDVQFRDTQPLYTGGAIRLRNVSFAGFNKDRVPFSFPPDFEQLILESHGKPINYVFEPVK